MSLVTSQNLVKDVEAHCDGSLQTIHLQGYDLRHNANINEEGFIRLSTALPYQGVSFGHQEASAYMPINKASDALRATESMKS